jgi:replicative DNA helicase
MLSISKIEEQIQFGMQKEAYLVKLEKCLDSKFISLRNTEIIEDMIKSVKEEIKLLQSTSIGNLEENLLKYDLDYDSLQNKTPKFIIKNLIIENDLTLFAAGAGVGKSLLMLLLSHHALSTFSVDKVIFFDLDNGLSTLQERNLASLKKKFKDKLTYIHESIVSLEKMQLFMDRLTDYDLARIMIIIDAGKNFITGDRDKNMDVSLAMKKFKALRNAGASVIILHHTNKTSPEREAEYAGSSAWKEDVANAFYLERNDYRNTFICIPFKKRSKNIDKIAFSYKASEFYIQPVDFDWAQENEEDEFIINSLRDYIGDHSEKPTWSMLISFAKSLGINKDKAHRVIKKGKDKYWKCTKIPEKNFRDVYELIDSSIDVDKSDKSTKSSNTTKEGS